ncbi:hypothetical protein PR202_gb29334 [Eleusine coracana subsp. coracana]|uniref:Uncharacterized protein n=1 Tax=Eleusine coracana subsp. coracana TaxID=191504 RepID=A0AAV5G126_ELECO|nr:hypothetical protein PR202_gb29334 [Eleusine coracana subsp. coracana]
MFSRHKGITDELANLDTPVDELPPLIAHDLYRVTDETGFRAYADLLSHMVEGIRRSSGVIINTFDAIEGTHIKQIYCDISILVFAIGPLHVISPYVDSSLLIQDRSCLEWVSTSQIGVCNLGDSVREGQELKKFAKAIARACIAALSDVELTSSEGLTSSEEEVEKPRVKRKDDFTGLCFMAKNDHDTDSGSDSNTREVPPTLDELSSKLDHLRDILLLQDDKLRSAVRESRELKSKLESADFEMTSLRSKLACDVTVVECESCQVVMNDLSQRESVHAQVASQLESALKELDEFKARPTPLGACQKCPKLISELEAQTLKVKELESKLLIETRSKVFPPPCEVCVSLKDKLVIN